MFAVLVWSSLGLLVAAINKRKDGRAFLLSSCAFLGLWGTAGAVHYPNLVRATDPALSLTIANASSSALTLKVMLVIALIGMPLVIGYTIYAYRVFKGKVEIDGPGY
jgi:cytochrome d ubiquinol oxidase subunit II